MKLALWGGALALLVACGGTAVIDVDSGSGGSGSGAMGSGAGAPGPGSSSTTTSAGGSTGECTSFVPCCHDITGEELPYLCDEQGQPYCPAGASFSMDGQCLPATACLHVGDCGSNGWCDFPDDTCGLNEPGTCKPRPQGCNDIYAPVCVCNGTVAGNQCDGESAGLDIDVNGGCMPPGGHFACGGLFCVEGFSYCRHEVSDVDGIPDTFQCVNLPPHCTNMPSCTCVQNEPCSNLCEDNGGNLTLTCPGG